MQQTYPNAPLAHYGAARFTILITGRLSQSNAKQNASNESELTKPRKPPLQLYSANTPGGIVRRTRTFISRSLICLSTLLARLALRIEPKD